MLCEVKGEKESTSGTSQEQSGMECPREHAEIFSPIPFPRGGGEITNPCISKDGTEQKSGFPVTSYRKWTIQNT